jgi:hypothetical protein
MSLGIYVQSFAELPAALSGDWAPRRDKVARAWATRRARDF